MRRTPGGPQLFPSAAVEPAIAAGVPPQDRYATRHARRSCRDRRGKRGQIDRAVEARHLAAFESTWFKDRQGEAVYVGPTMLWKLNEQVALNATWQPQVSGRSQLNPDLRYDLDNLERAQFRFKLVVTLN